MTNRELEAEIARLRSVCEYFDVDPDWEKPKPLYTVETEYEHRMRLLSTPMINMLARHFGETLYESSWFTPGARIGRTLRIVKPNSYTVSDADD